MSRISRKKQLLIKVQEPFYIHKTLSNGEEMTIMVAKYALPWKALTNVPLCDAVMRKISKVQKAFSDAHIDFNFDRENPAFVFDVSGKTVSHKEDIPNKTIGEKVAKAKALARACTICKAISLAAKEGLEEELNRNIDVLNVWYEKEKEIIRGI